MRSLQGILARTAFLLCLILLHPGSHASILAQSTPIPSGRATPDNPPADSILLTVTVTDEKGRHITGLDKSAFSLEDNKIPQEINFFAAGDSPASIGIVIDLSESAKNNSLKVAWEQILRLVKKGHPESEYFVVGFAGSAQVFVGWTRGNKLLTEKLSDYQTAVDAERTALYDACYLALDRLSTSTYSKQVILLASDGLDTSSRHTVKQVRERLKESGVLFYGIGYPPDKDLADILALKGKSVMDQLTGVSGGEAFFPQTANDVQWIADEIAVELQHQYVLGFKPPAEKADGKWHKFKIKATLPPGMLAHNPKLYVRSREGYYATANPR